jgi:1-acyl-sn-glycerol-3-phosphate acyltransferase
VEGGKAILRNASLAPAIYGLSKRAVAAYLALYGVRTQVHGVERIPRHGAAILVANHPSVLDGWLLVQAIPRKLHFFFRAEYFANPVLAWYGRLMGAVPAGDRATSDTSLAAAADILANHGLFLSFPEGTVNSGPELLPFRSGFTRLATALDVPVIPIVIRGSEAIVKPGRGRRSAAPELTILSPVRFDNRALDRAIVDVHRQHIRSLIADQLRNHTSWSTDRD